MTTVVRTSSSRLTGGWTLAGCQLAYAAWYALCAYLTLAHAAGFAGHWYIPSRDDAYTAEADIWAGWPWATVIGLTAPMAPVVAALSLIVSAAVFLTGYARGNRALTVTLIAGAVAMVAVTVVSLTPAAQSVTGWLMD
jgi:hypothetical protein